jgi:hypothetical protein
MDNRRHDYDFIFVYCLLQTLDHRVIWMGVRFIPVEFLEGLIERVKRSCRRDRSGDPMPQFF